MISALDKQEVGCPDPAAAVDINECLRKRLAIISKSRILMALIEAVLI